MGNFFPHLAPPSKSTLMKPLPPRPVPCTLQHIHCWWKLPPNTKGFPNKAEEHNPTDTPPPRSHRAPGTYPSRVKTATKHSIRVGKPTSPQEWETHFYLLTEVCCRKKFFPPPPNLLSKAEFSFSKLPPLSPKCWDLLSTVTSAGNSKGAQNYCIKPTSNAFTHKMPNFLPGSSLPPK